MDKKFTNELESVFSFMKTTLAREHPNLKLSINYFILAILEHRTSIAYNILSDCISTTTFGTIHDSYYQMVKDKSLLAIKPNREITFDDSVNRIIDLAEKEREKSGDAVISSAHMVLAILSDENDDIKTKKVFKAAGLNYLIFSNKLLDEKLSEIPEVETTNDESSIEETPKKKNSDNKTQKDDKNDRVSSFGFSSFLDTDRTNSSVHYINQYCINLNKRANKGEIEPITGREKEIKEIIRVLGRKKKNNAILVGEEGVGKTAVCENLACLIEENNVPRFLLKKQIVALDMMSMIAGTQWRGMLEERIKGLIKELEDNPNYILFIDDIESIFSGRKSSSDVDMATVFGNAFASGKIQAIATTTFKGYKKTFDDSPTLANKFNKIIIDIPNKTDAVTMLCNSKKQYEKFHSVKIGNDIIKLCVDLASKYMTDKNLPDSAIDIIDEVGASISSMVNEPEKIQDLKNTIKRIKKEIKQAIKSDNQEKIDELTEKEHQTKLELIEIEKQYQKDFANRPEITEDMVYQVVSEQTDIPLTKLSVDDKKALIGINDILKQSIIGQDEAIDVVSRVIKRNRVGITNGRTMANLFFIGGTGCGKTLLAKKLAQEIFGDEKYLVRFDMSEYSDKSSVSKLIGSSPGLVGYENGGLLTEAIKHKKHCVLLLDEIEKADPDVYNIFLQLFDEGHLTDNTGQRIDFKNVIIIMTSNIGVRSANDFGSGIGFNANVDKNKKDILKKELNKQFPPEFLNRIDDIVYFNELNNDNIKNIIKLELGKLNKRIKDIGYSIKYSDSTVDYLFTIVKNEKKFGARPVIRTIQDEIENVITDLILENDYLEHTFEANIKDDKLIIV